MKNKKSYRYPWHFDSRFQLLIDGTQYFESMRNEIKNAQNLILIEQYLFESGKTANYFIDDLCQAKKRGVTICILFDDYGTKNLLESDRKKLTDTGIELSNYNPTSFFNLANSLKRNHRKLLVIDYNIAFMGGAGITDQFNPSLSRDYWHDVMLKIEGNIVSDLINSFNETWQRQKIASSYSSSEFKTQKKFSHNNKNKARILLSEGSNKNEINRAIISHIRSSKHRVWLTSPYFISSWKVRRALRYAAKKGVDVRLLFPGAHSDHPWITHGIRRYYKRLLKAKVAIYEFQPRFTHSKIILADDWFTIGSSNLDRWNQFLNLDCNIEVYDKDTCQKIVQLFISNFSESKEITFNDWKKRSYKQKIKEWLSGIIIYGLGHILRKFKR